MRNIKLFGKVFLASALTLTLNNSCTNLDETIYSQVLEKDFFKSDQEFIAALGASYTSLYGMMGGHNGLWSDQEVASDELMIPQRGGDWFDGGQWLRMHRHEYLPTEDSFNNTWTACYGGITTCNRLMEQLSAADAAKAKPFIAELKTLRALFYFWLLDMFGNVPIETKFTGADPAPANKTRAEVFAFVEKELSENVPLLTKGVDGSTYARINYYTGKALQAKLYLNAQVYTGTAKWAEAQAAADEIINSGKYALEANMLDNFKTNNSSSKENIFVIPYDKVFANGFNLVQMTLHYESQKTYNLQAQPWNGYCSLSEFYNSYDDKDIRKKGLLAGPQYSSTGEPLVDGGAEKNDPDGTALNFTPKINEHFPNCLRQAGARIGKFEYAAGSTPNLDNDFPIFRLGDIVLVKAECLFRQGKTADALVEINKIRKRSGAAEWVAADLTADKLLAERGREMFAEGWRRQDLIRFGAYGKAYNEFKPADTKTCNIVFPIPTNQLNGNKNLKQNDCYK